MSALSDDEHEDWEYEAVERSESKRRTLYETELRDPRVALSTLVPLVEFEDGSLRITKRLR